MQGALDDSLAAGRRFEEVGGEIRHSWHGARRPPLPARPGGPGRGPPVGRRGARAGTRLGAPRAVGAALRAAGLVEGGKEGLRLLEEAVEVLADSPPSSSTRRRAPSWERRFDAPTVAHKRAITSAVPSSWRRFAVPCRSQLAPSPNCSRPEHGRAGSP